MIHCTQLLLLILMMQRMCIEKMLHKKVTVFFSACSFSSRGLEHGVLHSSVKRCYLYTFSDYVIKLKTVYFLSVISTFTFQDLERSVEHCSRCTWLHTHFGLTTAIRHFSSITPFKYHFSDIQSVKTRTFFVFRVEQETDPISSNQRTVLHGERLRF